MHSGLGINYLIKTLDLVKIEKSYSELYKYSPYRYKKSFLALLKSLHENHLIIKRKHYTRARNKRANVYYSISFKGEMLLDLIQNISILEENYEKP